MNFLITNKKNINIKDFKFKLQLTKKYFIFSDDKLKIFKIRNQIIIIDGEIFGYYNRDKFINLNQNKLGNYINNKNLLKNLDGNYCIIKISKNKIHFNIDNKGSYDLFYSNNKNIISFSNNFKLVKDLNYNYLTFDNFAILNAISSVSKRPPLKRTIFNEIKRIDLDQEIIIKNDQIKILSKKIKPKKIKEIISEKVFLENYEKELKEYSKAGTKKNKILFMSSGWDSLMILKLLIDKYGKKRVKPVIAKLNFSKSSKIFNKYEIDKAKKICVHLNIKLNIITINYDNISNYFDHLNKICSKKMLTNTFAYFLHYNLIRFGKKKFGASDFYSGEISDGAHNFGFSQYASLIDSENNGYREYADKMMCYLFGPTFFKKVVNGSYLDDVIFQFLKNKLNIQTKKISQNKKKIFQNFMQSMFLTSKRFPMNNEISDFLNKRSVKKYLSVFNESYLKNINFTDQRQIYASYIYLYNKFHWQGSTVRSAYHISREFNSNFINIFWNQNTQKTLSEMPESMGRGLELKETKYPEKQTLRKSIDVNKLNVGPHSYLSDTSNANPYHEVIFKSKFRKIISETFKEYNPIKFLNKDYFDHKFIKSLIFDFKNKKKSYSPEMIYSLYCFSQLLKDIKY
jgi:hypothetical protein